MPPQPPSAHFRSPAPAFETTIVEPTAVYCTNGARVYVIRLDIDLKKKKKAQTRHQKPPIEFVIILVIVSIVKIVSSSSSFFLSSYSSSSCVGIEPAGRTAKTLWQWR